MRKPDIPRNISNSFSGYDFSSISTLSYGESGVQMPVSPSFLYKTKIYVMTNKEVPGLVKIGESDNPRRRAREISTKLNLGPSMTIEHVIDYPLGLHLEHCLHRVLREKRVTEIDGKSLGKEFFAITSHEAVDLVQSYALPEKAIDKVISYLKEWTEGYRNTLKEFIDFVWHMKRTGYRTSLSALEMHFVRVAVARIKAQKANKGFDELVL